MFYHPVNFKDDFENYISSWLRICEEIRKRAETSLKLFDMIFCLTEISAAPVVDVELVAALPDLAEGEDVEGGEEEEGDQVEPHQGDGGGDKTVSLVHPGSDCSSPSQRKSQYL